MEQKEEKKKKSPYRALLLIPIMVVLFGLSVAGGLFLDTCMIKWSPSAQGHPIPVFTIILPSLMFIVGVVVIIIAIIVTIVRCLK